MDGHNQRRLAGRKFGPYFRLNPNCHSCFGNLAVEEPNRATLYCDAFEAAFVEFIADVHRLSGVTLGNDLILACSPVFNSILEDLDRIALPTVAWEIARARQDGTLIGVSTEARYQSAFRPVEHKRKKLLSKYAGLNPQGYRMKNLLLL